MFFLGSERKSKEEAGWSPNAHWLGLAFGLGRSVMVWLAAGSVGSILLLLLLRTEYRRKEEELSASYFSSEKTPNCIP